MLADAEVVSETLAEATTVESTCVVPVVATSEVTGNVLVVSAA
ncbi:hypothetical protein BOVMAS05_19410 [Streptococcus uberis]